MLFGSNKVLGLDIGTSSIKIAELDLGRSGATLTGFSMVPTPAQSFSAGEVTDPVGLSSALRSVVQKLGSRRREASIGLWGNAIIVRKISIPRMDEKLVHEQLRWEA